MNLLAINIAFGVIILLMLIIFTLLRYQLILFFGTKNNTENMKKTIKESRQEKNATSNVLFTDESLTTIPFNTELVQDVFCKNIKENDLKIVEGINPKIEKLFHVFGINTWKDLGETSVEKCQKILKSVGDRYKIQKPKTWPKQAKLAYQGKWHELQQWQGELATGK